MESYYMEKGVFLSNANLDSTLLLNCLHALLSHYPAIKFTSIISDDKLQGYRVHFAGQDVKTVLEKKQLKIADEIVGIYPLTTILSIDGVGVFENPLFEDDVLEALSVKYGKVSGVIKYDSEAVADTLNKKCENSLDTTKGESWEKKWRVRVDVPEFESVEVFSRESEMMIFLPKWDKNLKVKFWCRLCRNCGHFQYNCSKNTQLEIAIASVSNGKINNENKMLPPNMQAQLNSTTQVVIKERVSESYQTYSPESTENIVENEKKQKGRKSRNSDEQNQKSKKIRKSDSDVKFEQNKSFPTLKNIKKEVEEEIDDHYNDKKRKSMDYENSDNTDNENQSDGEGDVRRYMSYEEETKLCIDSASNDDSDYSGKAAEAKSDENSNSTLVEVKEKEKALVPFLPATPSGPSHSVSATSSSILGAADTSILSDELQGYINQACETIGALDRQTLDAFLGYVKKKNKPTQIALKYTPNVKQLKAQLQMILTLRYHTKPTNQIKEDAVFIKWLEGLVSRFDNTKPSKRKRIGQD